MRRLLATLALGLATSVLFTGCGLREGANEDDDSMSEGAGSAADRDRLASGGRTIEDLAQDQNEGKTSGADEQMGTRTQEDGDSWVTGSDPTGSTGTVIGKSVSARIYYVGAEAAGVNKSIARAKISSEIEDIQLLERIVSYRNDRRATVEFSIPDPASITDMEMTVNAYNDDAKLKRGVRFLLDGVGGYLGVMGFSEKDVDGQGVMLPGTTMTWSYHVSEVITGHTLGEGQGAGSTQSLLEVLKQSGKHKIEIWVSTYGTQGPRSWVSLKLRVHRKAGAIDPKATSD